MRAWLSGAALEGCRCVGTGSPKGESGRSRRPKSSNTLASEGYNMDRRKFLQMAGVGAASPFFNLEALAQGPTDRVLIVTEMTPNSLDTHTVGANRGAYGVVWMTYDRLITFGLKTLPNGVKSYD